MSKPGYTSHLVWKHTEEEERVISQMGTTTLCMMNNTASRRKDKDRGHGVRDPLISICIGREERKAGDEDMMGGINPRLSQRRGGGIVAFCYG